MEEGSCVTGEDGCGVHFPARNSVSCRTRCCVLGCKSTSALHQTLRFHRLPRPGECYVTINTKLHRQEKFDRRKAWERALKRSDLTQNAKVCSLHFKKEDYIFPDVPSKHRFLRRDAVPSCNLPSPQLTSDPEKRRQIHDFRRGDARPDDAGVSKETSYDSSQKSDGKGEGSAERIVSPANLAFLQDHLYFSLRSNRVQESEDNAEQVQYAVSSEKAIFEDKAMQVERSAFSEPTLFQDKAVQEKCCISKYLINNQSELITLTGIASFEMLDTIIHIARIVTGPSLINKPRKLSDKDKVIMTFIKLKQNVSYAILAAMFKICSENCRRIVVKMLDILSVALKFSITWPSKDEILKNMPDCFNDFVNVRAVIDVFEISIQKPINSCCQTASYSNNKGANTIKFMTAVSPEGLITFTSKAYLGTSSDKSIFVQSGFIDLIDKGDALMTDQGFLIDDVCKSRSIELIKPPLLNKKSRSFKEKSALNTKIAKARVHIKKSNQRLRSFKILSNKLPSKLVPRIEQIFVILCAIVNMSLPILNDNKFSK